MRTLYVAFLILGLTSGVYMETCPSEEDISPCTCFDQSDNGDLLVTCTDLPDLETLRKSLSSLSGKRDIDLLIDECKISTVPSNLFYGLAIRRLQFDHCDLDSFEKPVLHGLEDYLEEFAILGDTEENIPAKINLGHMKKLKEIEFAYNAITELGDDWFNNGPSSLETLIISNNGIEKIGSNAFAQLNNLKYLALDGNRFGSIKRSMFPSTADKLKRLELDNNALTDIPQDIFSRMPSISSISLQTNGITTLDESTWSPVWQQLDELRLHGNYIHCDDRLNWISRSKRRPRVYGRCSVPKELEGHDLESFFESRSR